jgi:RHS repeat-associated protein
MVRSFFILLILPSLLLSNWEELFNDDSDPSLVNHVNVISGNLQIFSEDAIVSGAVPIHLTRSYSSIGANERAEKKEYSTKKYDLIWKMEGGWNFLPHLQMLVDPRANGGKGLVVYAKEPSGEMLTYKVVHQKELFDLTLKPEKRSGPSFGAISGRLNPNNNILNINYKEGSAILHLANGGKRIYKGEKRGVIDVVSDNNIHLLERRLRHYLLQEEISPSGQKTCYEYRNDYPKGVKIFTCNLSGTKIYASINLEELHYSPPFSIKVTTSDQREIRYEGWSFKDLDYLSFVANATTVLDEMSYKKTRKSRGCALETLHSWGDEKLHVIYYEPDSREDEEKWIKKPHKKPLEIDKVKSVHRLNSLLSSFSYFPGLTEVRDENGILRKYYHKNNNLTLIEYFDENENLYSSQKFIWKDENLIAKVMCTADGKGLFSKTFEYDSYSNVLKESLYGSFSGEKEGPYEINDNGSLMGSEKYINSFEYDDLTHLLTLEREGNGLTNTYSYVEGTGLIETKKSFDNKKLLSTQTFTYDEDLLLIKETFDKDHVHLEKTYERDKKTGRVKAIEDQINRIEYSYTPYHEIAEETVFDSERNVLYHIDYKYDRFGHLLSKTTPCGNENRYTYTFSGDLISSKEVGSPETFYTYDEFHRMISSTSNGKTSNISYNTKGLITSKTDCYGNATDYKYDVFDRPTLTIFPEVKDTYGKSYRPTIECNYDLLGNLTFCKNAKGEIKKITYNILSKPLKECFPDGSVITNYYTTSGNLKKTLLPDGSCLYYTHDVLGRMTSKKSTLFSESWEYSPFGLTSYTDKKGLKTIYTYDTYGRKIKEDTHNRITTYSYDSLNFLSEITQEGITKKEIHDFEGNLIFEEICEENKTTYTYNKENRKTNISKHTSSGIATDIIEYDIEGRVIRHKDPYGNVSEFIYEGQTKISLDPEKNETHEKYDALNRLIEIENKNSSGDTVAKEELFYDKSGNLSRKLISIYQDTTFIKTVELNWEYDFRGLVTKEAQKEKVTLNEYDSLGRLSRKKLPSGVILTHTYDEESRLIELISSDGTIHYQYIYGLSVDPIQIKDLVKKSSLERSYNLFGELEKETTNENLTLSWDYDNLGRKISITLPDMSKIKYEYKGLHLKKIKRIRKDDTLEYEHCYLTFDKNGHVQNELLIHNLGEIKTTFDLLERPISVVSPFHKMETNYDARGLISNTQNSLFGKKQYKYDPLKQLFLENEIQYHFDSIGNPSDQNVNEYNELTSEFIYDANGNPIKNIEDSLQYSYDALGRLTSTLDEKNRKVVFSYDAYSRLSSKKIFQNDFPIRTRFYFYDQEHEIGSTNLFGEILDLKVLGLGLKEDIGGAVAIEIEGKVYAPLHDFRGNIIALISKSGEIIWTYDYDAFGNENSEISQNPWGFCSKRKEEGLVYFGKRFYNPEIKRWLTPDPLGYFESPNVYLYTLNSPLNRLDLFGLYSESDRGFYFEPTQFHKQESISPYYNKSPKVIFCKAILSENSKGAPVDAILISGSLHKINYSPSEIENNKANLLDHLHELTSFKENDISLITTQNGINTTLYEFAQNAKGHMNRLGDPNVLFIGLYNPSYGILPDSIRALIQLHKRTITENAKNTGEFLGLIADTFKSIESKSLWLHLPHSEAGLLFNLGYTLLDETQKEVLMNQLLVLALAPLEPVSWRHCLDADNVYSNKDSTTRRYGERLKNHPDYNIKFVECESKRSEFSAFFSDHAAKGATLNNQIARKYHFHKTTR